MRNPVLLAVFFAALTTPSFARLAVHAVLLKELNGFDEQVRKLAKGGARTRVGPTSA